MHLRWAKNNKVVARFKEPGPKTRNEGGALYNKDLSDSHRLLGPDMMTAEVSLTGATGRFSFPQSVILHFPS
jgi:hypothetical protein